MNHKHIFAGCITTIAVCGTSVALGFGQPDGIDPPAGPVGDTQPSLTSIDNKLNELAGIIYNERSVYLTPPVAHGESVQLSQGNIVLERVQQLTGTFTIRDANGVDLLFNAINFDPNTRTVYRVWLCKMHKIVPCTLSGHSFFPRPIYSFQQS